MGLWLEIFYFSASFHIIGMAVWAGEFEKNLSTSQRHFVGIMYGYSWGFAIVAAVLNLGALAPVIISRRRDDSSPGPGVVLT